MKKPVYTGLMITEFFVVSGREFSSAYFCPSAEAERKTLSKWVLISQFGFMPASARATCGLCDEYMNGIIDNCKFCPVYKRSGLKFCEGTPYAEWSECLSSFRSASAIDNDEEAMFADTMKNVAAAWADVEYEYLRQTLKKESEAL